MMKMIKLLPLWEKINNLLPIAQGEFITFLIESSCKFNFYYGIDSYANYLIAIETVEEPHQINLNSVSFDTFSYKRSDIGWFTVFVLKNKLLISVFDKLCEDLFYSVQEVHDENSLNALLQNRIKSWRNLLATGGNELLTEIQIQGLLAELVVFKSLLDKKIQCLDVAKSWLGPSKEEKDFKFKDFSIEVKSILPDADAVTISSLDQLSAYEDLYLYIVEFLKSPLVAFDTINLPVMVEKILIQLNIDPVAKNIFELKLLESGYSANEKYTGYNYYLNKIENFLVDDSFPKLTSKNVPVGILAANYKLSIDLLRGIKQ